LASTQAPHPRSWSFDALRRKADLVHEAMGARNPELHLNPDVWGVGRPRHAVVNQTARQLGLSPEDLDRSAHVLAGSMQQVVDYLGRLRETVGISYVTIPSDQMDEFAEVVDRLGGR